ncbi:hypothetical protein EV702DRAFT_1276016 [Suillus placidus]|uniref:Uncharacterized protein n=1 Tax=Suillus placidus TaxID=48579 RepID=A0A9P7D7B4_9AGAM|nr:hypothetical protein EV702DRAFT_1276016 [Suillus placidus]
MAVGVESIKLIHHLFTLKQTKSADDELAADIADDATSSDTTTSLGSEFDILNWPVADRCKAELTNLAETHIINPLPAYRIDRKLIPPAQYETKLCGAVVEVHFTFFHHHIRKSKCHIFNAVLCKMIMLRPPTNMSSSPLKRRKLGAGHSSDMPFKGKKCVHGSSTTNGK